VSLLEIQVKNDRAMNGDKNLLLFNLKTDADDGVLGFTTDWINTLAPHFKKLFVITMVAGKIRVAGNVTVYSVGKENGYSIPRRIFEFYRILYRLLHTEAIDACFAHMMPLFAVMAWPLLKAKRIPIVLWYAHKTVNTTLKIAVYLVDRVVTSSSTGFQIETNKKQVIGQGIDTERFCPPVNRNNKDVPFILLYVGRLSPIKHIEVLIEAMAKLVKERSGIKVQAKIIGGPLTTVDQKYASRLKLQAKDHGVDDGVEFIGSKSFHEVHKYYQMADCFVNPSDTDSVDKTVLEAMSCGVPIITSNIAFKEVLGTELATLWVIEKRNVNALYESLSLLMDMPISERRELGVMLREIVVRDHSLHRLSEKISNIVREVTLIEKD
jgi:glycosyltransferase involved in cell wall biosynthesis